MIIEQEKPLINRQSTWFRDKQAELERVQNDLQRAKAKLKNIQRTADINPSPGADVMARITIQGLENRLKYLDRVVNCEHHLMAAKAAYHAAVTELERQQQTIESVMYPIGRRPELQRAEQAVNAARKEYYCAHRWLCECQAQIVIADHAPVFAGAAHAKGHSYIAELTDKAVTAAKQAADVFLTEGGN